MNLNATLIVQTIVFLILGWITMKFIWPPLMQAIEERQKKIADGIAASDRAKKELAEADSRVADEIKKARVEAGSITDRAQKQYNEILDRAKVDAVSEAARIRAAAEDEIANLSFKAREVLRQQVAALAVAGAEKILQREIDANRHRDLLEALAKEI
jgi:F-type H+-transporting ATPase subunit b